MWQNFYEEDGLMRPPDEQKSNNLGAANALVDPCCAGTAGSV
jgi:hypothetical protein